MKILWEERAWEEYLEWQIQDKKTLKRINVLIKEIQRNCYEGTGAVFGVKDGFQIVIGIEINDHMAIIVGL